MADGKGYYGSRHFERPDLVIPKAVKKLSKKRALQDRLLEESPSKKSKQSLKNLRKPFGAQPPPPDDVTNEDSSLMDLFNMKYPTTTSSCRSSNFKSDSHNIGSSLSTSLSTSASSTASSMSPVRHSMSNVSCNSPISAYYNNQSSVPAHQSSKGPAAPCYLDFIDTTPTPKKRQVLTPAPLTSSPSWAGGNSTSPSRVKGTDRIRNDAIRGSRIRTKLEDKFAAEEALSKGVQNPCLDWSLKSKLLLVASKTFGWNSAGLKSSEESSGTSAFVRCLDIDPVDKDLAGYSCQGSQLDTTLGAQFHQCCLYWQHPSLPSVNLFPRDSSQSNLTPMAPSPLQGIRLEEKILESMLTEWIEAFRSIFQLLRTRQCPYFYICGNQFTSLFCAAGTQGLDYLQVYVTPSSKGFRDALTNEGIEFSMPYYYSPEGKHDQVKEKSRPDLNVTATSDKEVESEDEDAADKWLDEMGISQDVSLSLNIRSAPASQSEEKNKSTMVFIAGTNTLAFFNFLINSKAFLISNSGPFKGLPPTILSPVAFHGATLKSLKVKQNKGKVDTGDTSYSIEMVGPILPHVLHKLCPLLQKTVGDFKIYTSTQGSTKNLNLNSRARSSTGMAVGASAFDLQNLSDCGINKSLLELFCRPDSIDTIMGHIECKNNMYTWC